MDGKRDIREVHVRRAPPASVSDGSSSSQPGSPGGLMNMFADVVETFNVASAIMTPLPTVLFKRLQNDTAAQAKQIWTLMTGQDTDVPPTLPPSIAAAAQQPMQNSSSPSARHLRDEILVSQLRTLLSQDVEKVRRLLRFATNIRDKTTPAELVSATVGPAVDGGPSQTFSAYWLPMPRQPAPLLQRLQELGGPLRLPRSKSGSSTGAMATDDTAADGKDGAPLAALAKQLFGGLDLTALPSLEELVRKSSGRALHEMANVRSEVEMVLQNDVQGAQGAAVRQDKLPTIQRDSVLQDRLAQQNASDSTASGEPSAFAAQSGLPPAAAISTLVHGSAARAVPCGMQEAIANVAPDQGTMVIVDAIAKAAAGAAAGAGTHTSAQTSAAIPSAPVEHSPSPTVPVTEAAAQLPALSAPHAAAQPVDHSPASTPRAAAQLQLAASAQHLSGSEAVLLYIHGGAFAVGSALTYRAFYVALQQAMANRRLQCRVLSLRYTLAPDAHFPVQLHQALAAYRWLVGVKGCKRVLLGGDSAGGNLCLALMLKLRDSYPQLPAPLGALLLSPWSNLARVYPRERISDHDYLTISTESVQLVTKTYLGPSWSHEALQEPLVSPALADLRGLPPLWINAGGGEVLLEDIQDLVAAAKQAGVEVETLIEPNMYHVYPCLASAFGHEKALSAIQSMVDFVQKRLAA